MKRSRQRLWWLCLPLALFAGSAFAAEQGQKRPFRSHLHRGNPGADDRRPPARRSHVAHAPAGRDGPVDRRTFARTFFVRAAAPDFQHALFPKNPEQKAMIDAISQFGVLLLLLMTGMETDLKLVRQVGRAAIFASLCGIVVPFVCGVTLGEFMPESLLPDPSKRLITALFLGTALSIASVKIVAMVVREMNFMRRVVGQVILASAIIDDSVGWIIVSIIFSLALHGAVDGWSLAQSVIGTLVFMAASLTIGRRIVFFIIRWVNDTFVSEFAVVTAILAIMGAMALDHASHRRAYRARRFRRRHFGRRISDPHQAYRRAVARPDHGVLRAGVLRHCRPERGSHHLRRPEDRPADLRPDPDRQHRQVRRRVPRRRAGRSDPARRICAWPAA